MRECQTYYSISILGRHLPLFDRIWRTILLMGNVYHYIYRKHVFLISIFYWCSITTTERRGIFVTTLLKKIDLLHLYGKTHPTMIIFLTLGHKLRSFHDISILENVYRQNNWEITYFELMLHIYLMLSSHLEQFNHSLCHIMYIYRYIIQIKSKLISQSQNNGGKKKGKWTVPKSMNLFTSTFWIDIHLRVNI